MSTTLRCIKNPEIRQMLQEFDTDTLENSSIYRTPTELEEDINVPSHAPQVACNKENYCQMINQDVLVSIPPLPTSPELDVPTSQRQPQTPHNSRLVPNFNVRAGWLERGSATVHKSALDARLHIPSSHSAASTNFHTMTGAEHLFLSDWEEDLSTSPRGFQLIPKSFDFESHFVFATSPYED